MRRSKIRAGPIIPGKSCKKSVVPPTTKNDKTDNLLEKNQDGCIEENKVNNYGEKTIPNSSHTTIEELSNSENLNEVDINLKSACSSSSENLEKSSHDQPSISKKNNDSQSVFTSNLSKNDDIMNNNNKTTSKSNESLKVSNNINNSLLDSTIKNNSLSDSTDMAKQEELNSIKTNNISFASQHKSKVQVSFKY